MSCPVLFLIFIPLIRFSLSVLLALFLQTMYGACDLLIVGPFGGARADVFVSAVSTGSQVMQTLTLVVTGLAMGLTVFAVKHFFSCHIGDCKWSRIGCLFTFFHGDLLAGIFAKDTAIITASAEYLKAYAVDCVFTAFLFCFIGYFNGCGRTTFVMLQGTLCAFGVRMPITWLMSRQTPVSLFHIGLAIPASTIVAIALCGIYFVVMLRREKKNTISCKKHLKFFENAL